jgi:hypothetical protein
MMEHTLTIRFEIHDGDVTPQFLWPLAQTALTDVVQATFTDGKWTISATVGDFRFVGEPAEYKNQAILNFLKARLGLSESGEERGTP